MLSPINELHSIVAAIVGLIVGSFLNVVIHRLPKMIERTWKQEAAAMLDQEVYSEERPFNLALPRSCCTHCGHLIAWYQNIPVLSYLFLKGRCSHCKTQISIRYPLIELITSGLFYFCFVRYGAVWQQAALLCVFCAALVVLAMIDWDTMLLPDEVSLPLLWLGLISAACGYGLTQNLNDALWGAIGGYLSLWLVYWVFKFITKKEGIGYGDFKLFAALGAWFGVQLLIPVILLASVVGLLAALVLKTKGDLRESGYIPFGPFLAGAGLIVVLVGIPNIVTLMHGSFA